MQVPSQTVRKSSGRARRPKPGGAELQDRLSSIPERGDLEELFQKKVLFSQILRLTGKDVSRAGIKGLLTSPDLHGDLKRLLDS